MAFEFDGKLLKGPHSDTLWNSIEESFVLRQGADFLVKLDPLITNFTSDFTLNKFIDVCLAI